MNPIKKIYGIFFVLFQFFCKFGIISKLKLFFFFKSVYIPDLLSSTLTHVSKYLSSTASLAGHSGAASIPQVKTSMCLGTQ